MKGGGRKDQLRVCLVARSNIWANSGTSNRDIKWFYTPTPAVTNGFRIHTMWGTQVSTFPRCFTHRSVKTAATALTVISSHNHVQDRKKIKTSSPPFLSASIFFPRNSLGDLFLCLDCQEWVTNPSVNQLAASGNRVASLDMDQLWSIPWTREEPSFSKSHLNKSEEIKVGKAMCG